MNANLSFDPSIPVEDPSSETDDIIYRISHDLRASVRALQELPNWIVEDLDEAAVDLPGPTNRHLELISNHACRLDLMLTGLLEFSRVGRLQTISAINPDTVLREVVDDLCLPDEVKLKLRMDRGNIQIGHADLQRMFSILLTNAVRFHPQQTPRISISGGPISDREWAFEICDDGPGIPPDRAEFVQRPMTKLVSRDVDIGAGMGLAVLRKIAETFGGTVKIGVPKSGKGTRVTVRLVVN